jgi:hypothetical protein
VTITSSKRHTKWTAAVVAVGAIALVGAACGDDGSGGSAPEAFCEARIDLEEALTAEPPDEEAGDEALNALDENAPEDVSEQTTLVVDAAREDPDSLFEDPEVIDTRREVEQVIFDDCGFQQVEVTAAEYSFEGIPGELDADNTAFSFTNDGAEEHEMVLARIVSDVTLEELLELPEAEQEQNVEFQTATFAPAGETDYSFTDLESGRYAVVCFVETADGTPHVAEGMTFEFEVS